ncbi:28737_t:CDS:2, partial [Gigaspora margarita]
SKDVSNIKASIPTESSHTSNSEDMISENNKSLLETKLWSSLCPICNGKHGNYGLHGEWYRENGNQLPYDSKLAKLYSQDKLEYCLTCNTSSNKLKLIVA